MSRCWLTFSGELYRAQNHNPETSQTICVFSRWAKIGDKPLSIQSFFFLFLFELRKYNFFSRRCRNVIALVAYCLNISTLNLVKKLNYDFRKDLSFFQNLHPLSYSPHPHPNCSGKVFLNDTFWENSFCLMTMFHGTIPKQNTLKKCLVTLFFLKNQVSSKMLYPL